MKVTVISPTDKAKEKRDDRDYIEIYINGEIVFSAYDGEKEDATLSRDFNDCWSIPNLMKRAYEAGKKGDSLEISNEEEDEI